jgi:predicted RNase H-like HicB family nuclease
LIFRDPQRSAEYGVPCISFARGDITSEKLLLKDDFWEHYREKSLAGKVGFVAALTEYMQAAMRHAEYERLDDGDWYAHIPGLAGLWASAKAVEDTRKDLYSALEDWL